MFAETTVVGKGNQIQVVHGDDSGLWVEFYFNKVHQQPYVKIRVPGDNKTEWDKPVQEKHKRRFPKQWDAFNQQRSQFGDATMLEQWGVINDDQIRNLRSFNIQTVEQLAGLGDSQIEKVGPGARELVRKANAWIEGAASAAKEEKLQEALRSADDRIAALEAQIQQLHTAPVEAKQKRAYTRKTKEKA